MEVEDILNKLSMLDRKIFDQFQQYMKGECSLKDMDKTYKEIRSTLKEAAKMYKEHKNS